MDKVTSRRIAKSPRHGCDKVQSTSVQSFAGGCAANKVFIRHEAQSFKHVSAAKAAAKTVRCNRNTTLTLSHPHLPYYASLARLAA